MNSIASSHCTHKEIYFVSLTNGGLIFASCNVYSEFKVFFFVLSTKEIDWRIKVDKNRQPTADRTMRCWTVVRLYNRLWSKGEYKMPNPWIVKSQETLVTSSRLISIYQHTNRITHVKYIIEVYNLYYGIEHRRSRL